MDLLISFYYRDHKSDKFWSVSVSGNTQVIHFGRKGTPGQKRRTIFSSRDEALADSKKRASEKRAQGYVESSLQNEVTADSTARSDLRRLIESSRDRSVQLLKQECAEAMAKVDQRLQLSKRQIEDSLTSMSEKMRDPANSRNVALLESLMDRRERMGEKQRAIEQEAKQELEKIQRDVEVKIAATRELANKQAELLSYRIEPTDLATSRVAFLAKHGPIVMDDTATSLIHKCKPADHPQEMFSIAIWTTGWHLNGAKPDEVEDWQSLDHSVAIASSIAAALANERYGSSDDPFVAFVMAPISSVDTDFLASFAERLGCDLGRARAKFGQRFCPFETSPSVFHEDYEYEADFTDICDDLDREERKAIAKSKRDFDSASRIMWANLRETRCISLGWDYTYQPKFWLGVGPGNYLVGVFSVN